MLASLLMFAGPIARPVIRETKLLLLLTNALVANKPPQTHTQVHGPAGSIPDREGEGVVILMARWFSSI
jgi:hypothetical protein